VCVVVSRSGYEVSCSVRVDPRVAIVDSNSIFWDHGLFVFAIFAVPKPELPGIFIILQHVLLWHSLVIQSTGVFSVPRVQVDLARKPFGEARLAPFRNVARDDGLGSVRVDKIYGGAGFFGFADVTGSLLQFHAKSVVDDFAAEGSGSRGRRHGRDRVVFARKCGHRFRQAVVVEESLGHQLAAEFRQPRKGLLRRALPHELRGVVSAQKPALPLTPTKAVGVLRAR